MKKLTVETRKILFRFIVVISTLVVGVAYFLPQITPKTLVIFFSFLGIGFLFPWAKVIDEDNNKKNKNNF
ncbi:MAG: hypothetical protein WCX46_03615 [Candidatus Paceibacterota bacterium]